MCKRLIVLGAALALGVCAAAANAAIVFDTSTVGTPWGDFYPNDLDDINAAGGGPVTIRSMLFGVESFADTDVDAIVTFWDSVDTSVPITDMSTVVNSDQLGSFRMPLGLISNGEVYTTGLFNLPTPITDSDGSFGVQIQVVLAGTDTMTYDVTPLLSAGEFDYPTVGTSVQSYWQDVNESGSTFTGDEQAYYANLRLQLSDTVVPEPCGLALIGLAAFPLLLRRKRA